MSEGPDYIISDLWPNTQEIDDFHLEPANSLEHNDEDLQEIAASLKEFGQRTPIVINSKTGVIEKGNGTWMAARMLGWTRIAAVSVEDDPVTAARYGIADNATGRIAQWNFGNLHTVMTALEDDPDTIPGVTPEFWTGIKDAIALDNGPPSLDDLEAEYGEPEERDFWPIIRVQVSPETMELFNSFMGQLPGEDEAVKMAAILGAVDTTLLGSIGS